MHWVVGGLTLIAVASLLRRVLHMSAPNTDLSNRQAAPHMEVQAVYRPIAQEIETQAAILGITLNDAFGEREARRHEMAWRIVHLALKEWERLSEVGIGLLSVLNRFLPTTEVVVARRIAVAHFKSRAVLDNVALYEFLDQVLFSSKHRFALQLRLLFRTSTLLNKEFRRVCLEGEQTMDASDETWNRLDHYFHDFDLILKETLLAFQTLLACQPPGRAEQLGIEVQGLLERGTRASISQSTQ